MTFQLTTRRVLILLAVALVCALYLFDLPGMGMVSKDEPRYAWIGRAMAQTGDWITPRLWGKPWFEKPALLYWLIALGFDAHLGNDLAPRLPIALLSLGFLVFFWWRLRRLWDERVASYSTAMLATTAGWLAYSHVAVTDLPLAALFSAAVLFALEDTARGRVLAAVALGLATLAKSLLPLVLFVPVLAVNYRQMRQWLRPLPLLAFAAVALPWYIVCTLRNGREFPRVLLLEQTISRFHSPVLQHIQPAWYYIPVILLLLFPWFPLLALLPRDLLRDRRLLTLVAVAVFGFVFFSSSVNKLPSYLLPLVPSICILMGVGVARRGIARVTVACVFALIAALPVAARVIPAALARGLHTSPIPYLTLGLWICGGALAGIAVSFLFPGRLFVCSAAATAVAFLWFQTAAFPAIDNAASARTMWFETRPACSPDIERGLLYSLYYYAGRVLPPCPRVDQAPMRVVR